MKNLSDLNLKNLTFRGCADEEHDQLSVFFKILNEIESENPSMVELGCCDAYYSIIFNKFFDNKNAFNYCIEINDDFLKIGMDNSKKNSCKNMLFFKGGIGDINYSSEHVMCDGIDDVEKYKLSYFLKKNKIDYLDVLHMDIQGTEVSVLEDIVENRLNEKIKYCFISTHHSDGIFGETYEKCHEILNNVNKTIYFDDKYRGGIGDGLIVLKFL